jgi:tetratricopeptide (TPR) repeat protein
LREDIIIADKYGYIEKNLYAHMPHEITSHFRKIPTPQERHMIERWILTDTSRPIFFTKKRDMQDCPSLELTPWGLTYKLVKKSDADTIVKPDLWASYELRSLESDSPKDYSAHSILCDYYFARGRDYLYEGEKDKALKQFDLVIQEGWGVKEIYNNLGSVCAENGLLSESIAYFEKALELDPDYVLALQNLVKLHEHIGDYEKAIEYQKSLLGARPDDPEILLHIATLYERMHDLENAVKTYHSVTRLAPQDFRPYRSLGYIYLSLPQARPDAALMFSKSLDRNPDQPDVKRLLNNLWGGKSTAVEQTANVLR